MREARVGGGSGRDRQGLQCCRRVGLLTRVIVCVLMLQLVRVHVLLLQLFTAPDGSRGIQIDASGASSLVWRSGVLRALNLACHEANSDSMIFPARARARARAPADAVCGTHRGGGRSQRRESG